MKKSILTVIAAVAALLVISGVGYSYDVVDVQVSSYMYGDASEYGNYGHSIFNWAYTVAYAEMYGSDDPQYAYSYAQEMRSVTIVDYDSQSDPNLTAVLDGYTGLDAYVWGYPGSDYWVCATGKTYIDGLYSDLSIELEPPYDEDHVDDGYVEYEDVSYNNASINYGHSSNSWVYLDTTSYIEGYVYSSYASVNVTIEED